MSKEANIAILTKFATAVNTGNFDLFQEAVAIDNVDHDPAPGQVPGPEGYRMYFSALRAAFPDLSVAPETLVGDDDSLAFAYTITGTQNGPLMGIAPTGRKIKIRGLQISKFKDGKMVERWGSSDELGMLLQLGVAVVPAQSRSANS
jgi:predicted ester cyclase